MAGEEVAVSWQPSITRFNMWYWKNLFDTLHAKESLVQLGCIRPITGIANTLENQFKISGKLFELESFEGGEEYDKMRMPLKCKYETRIYRMNISPIWDVSSYFKKPKNQKL